MTSIDLAVFVQQLNEIEQAIQNSQNCYELRKSQLNILIEIMNSSIIEINELKAEMRKPVFPCGECRNCKEERDV
jgi:DNA replicative helicase MCM subunit Mcm2 (Cdc46/Mcm family)